jgi:hypothetical protein
MLKIFNEKIFRLKDGEGTDCFVLSDGNVSYSFYWGSSSLK